MLILCELAALAAVVAFAASNQFPIAIALVIGIGALMFLKHLIQKTWLFKLISVIQAAAMAAIIFFCWPFVQASIT